VDNEQNPVVAATTVQIPKERWHNSQKGLPNIVKTLVVQGKANLIIKGEHFGLTFDSLQVFEDSAVEFGQ